MTPNRTWDQPNRGAHPRFKVRVPGKGTGRGLALALFVLITKPIADALSERTRDTVFNLGTAWTLIPLALVIVWIATSRRRSANTWVLLLLLVTMAVLEVLRAIAWSGPDGLVDGFKVIAGLAPAFLLFAATDRKRNEFAFHRWRTLAVIGVVAVALHIVVAWLQFGGALPTTYTQAGVGRPSGLYFHPISLGYLLVFAQITVGLLRTRRVLPRWSTLMATIVFGATIAAGTHRTSMIAWLMVILLWSGFELARALVHRPLVRVGTIISTLALTLVLLGAAGLAPEQATRPVRDVATGLTAVLSPSDLDPFSDRFLRGRGQRWRAAIDVLLAQDVARRAFGVGFEVVDPHSDFLRLPLVHGVLGSTVLLLLLAWIVQTALVSADRSGRMWIGVAVLVMAVYAITAKPTSYPSFLWAWTFVLWLGSRGKLATRSAHVQKNEVMPQ